MKVNLNNSSLHYTILKKIIHDGYAPNIEELTQIFEVNRDTIVASLNELQDYHGVVLHPNEPKIWVIHPFSLAPTNFFVQSKSGSWWGNCAWCSLGVAALLKEDVIITTTIGGEKKQIEIHIINGKIQEDYFYIHFPIAMKDAWKNVIYTCSNMLVFENEQQVTDWSIKHNIPRGDIQPIDKIWEFSKKWYGNHLNPEWKKWTMEEAKQIFKEYLLSNRIWNLEDSSERF